jgi:phenylphosphate carboxylase gamma subunit
LQSYDVFVDKLTDLSEGKEVELSLRDLTPGIHKYCYRNVTAVVSSDPETYADKLQIRFGRGQLHPYTYSLKIISDVEKIPAHWK